MVLFMTVSVPLAQFSTYLNYVASHQAATHAARSRVAGRVAVSLMLSVAALLTITVGVVAAVVLHPAFAAFCVLGVLFAIMAICLLVRTKLPKFDPNKPPRMDICIRQTGFEDFFKEMRQLTEAFFADGAKASAGTPPRPSSAPGHISDEKLPLLTERVSADSQGQPVDGHTGPTSAESDSATSGPNATADEQ